jgi:hypothetical protein
MEINYDFNRGMTLEEQREVTDRIIEKFNKLQKEATELGFPICLNTQTSVPLELYWHDDYDGRILVDKELSNVQKKCPKCGNLLHPSDVVGYEYVCYQCDENFYGCEAIDYRS